MGKCTTPYCRNESEKGRTICTKCIKRKYRENNKMKASYQNLKDNSKRRGKDFSLTFEEFKAFCIKTEYITKKGKNKDGYTIDRKEQDKGYHSWNIQVLTNSNNVKKYYWDAKYSEGQMEFRFRQEATPNDTDVPF